jgi:hypothetical protein
MALTSGWGMDPFAMFDPMFFDVSGGLGGLGSADVGLGGLGGGLGTTTTGRRRATMPADVVETPVRARRARARVCVRADVGTGGRCLRRAARLRCFCVLTRATLRARARRARRTSSA